MGFNIQSVVNEIIQPTQTTYFPLYSRSWAQVCVTNPKGLSCSGGVFRATWLQYKCTASSDPPLDQDGWAQNALWEWAVAHNTKTLHKVSAVHAPRSCRAQEPLPELESTSTPISFCTSCRSLQFGSHSASWPFPVDRSRQERGNICRCCCNFKAFPARPGKTEVLPMCLKSAETSGANLLSS